MQKVTSEKLAEILGVPSDGIVSAEIDDVCTDSRKVTPSSLFIALRGERFDAHDFVPEVLENGCPLAVVDHLVAGAPAERQLVVGDTLRAFGKIGAYNRSLFKGTVICLTGSAGKTTTKDEIAFLLSEFAPVYATAGNHNNAVGVPMSLCGLDMRAKYAVVETGMSHKGEISYLTSLVKPDVAVITNVYPMHIEFFENLEGIARAKAEIFEGLKRGGIAVINEDTNYASLLEEAAAARGAVIKTFGKKHHPAADFVLQDDSEKNRYNAWCALSVVEALGLDVQKAAARIKDFGAPDGRGRHHTLKMRGGTYTLVDDSYSGQPEAMIAAIKDLDKMQGRKIAVLGKMAELGSTSKARHEEVGRLLAQSSVDIVIGVCPETKDILVQLPATKQQYYFETQEKVADFLTDKILQNGDVVLVKGARYSSQVYKTAAELIKRGEAK